MAGKLYSLVLNYRRSKRRFSYIYNEVANALYFYKVIMHQVRGINKIQFIV